MLLCGSDLLESFCKPGVWRPPDVEHILKVHGVVCVVRRGSQPWALLNDAASPLHSYKHSVIMVEDPFDNAVSSSIVREELGRKHSLKYIVPDAVLAYIKANGLYTM